MKPLLVLRKSVGLGERLWPVLLLLLGPAAARAAADPGLVKLARAFERQLTNQVLPYWYDTARDVDCGGYRLADDGQGGAGGSTDKQLVSQSRMVWGFAHAHRKGYRDRQRDYLRAAREGYRFLIDHFLDREHGGYFWKTTRTGQVVNDGKFLYGEAFVIYAFVEYARASRETEPVRHALELFRTLHARLHDTEQGGWREHTSADWQPLAAGDPRNEVEVIGYKSANAHLHWMEALAELYETTRDPAVRTALEECLRLNRTYFYPRDPGRSCFHRQPDWQTVSAPASAGLSYGHNVEFAWLMIRAQRALGVAPDWDHFRAHLDHALQYGYDTAQGGLYYRGTGDAPATDRHKVWWSQAEMLAALSDAYAHQPEPPIAEALHSLLRFLTTHQIDPRDGIWRDTVAADGRPQRPAKAHAWKANYHDLRAIVKFVETFPPAAR